jgi:hypothetical protein
MGGGWECGSKWELGWSWVIERLVRGVGLRSGRQAYFGKAFRKEIFLLL